MFTQVQGVRVVLFVVFLYTLFSIFIFLFTPIIYKNQNILKYLDRTNSIPE